ncbi:NADH dehydrogenase [Actinoplanes sp. SE50]|uniref:NAD(P)/FAD-dependent oxidoreductase n=1 Tax=unclassified Actinoplanes TaxID=2626549 RepID=UPI00023EC8BD|nr:MULTISPECIES: FAD-dependent oxidoreductase [unclassified Actinoplanes]AEV81486.1 NADH dehydrogenase [Actinoplanes sp. SE50/110]ATO79889.1 NADH dehydrogenase [Actinoplanes sp. SE50]SLL97291.1 NADH dehydrogenase [Actinoplanes sp. SE50/110]
MPRPRILIVGAGFAGHAAARRLARIAGGRAEIVLLNPTDYFLYLPLLPEVATGLLEPRRVSVPLARDGVRVVLGHAGSFDLDARTVEWADPEGRRGVLGYHRLVLALGSVNRLLPIPGVTEYAHGFRGLAEALYLRDHLIRQIELAAQSSDPVERRARCTFVVAGAGYTGTEVTAQGALFTAALAASRPLIRDLPRWLILDTADRVLPTLDPRLSHTAADVLRRRGVRVLTGASVQEAGADGVRLSTGEKILTRTLVWCVGVRPEPLVTGLGLATREGRLVVDEFLNVPGRPDVFACGDAAAVPDVLRPGSLTGMTAQHAVRQGRLVAGNIAASYGQGRRRPYRHRDLGFTVDLGGWAAAANPFGVPLSGVVAKAMTRGYHLAAMPGNRVRVTADWALDAALSRQPVQLGMVRGSAVPLRG